MSRSTPLVLPHSGDEKVVARAKMRTYFPSRFSFEDQMRLVGMIERVRPESTEPPYVYLGYDAGISHPGFPAAGYIEAWTSTMSVVVASVAIIDTPSGRELRDLWRNVMHATELHVEVKVDEISELWARKRGAGRAPLERDDFADRFQKFIDE